jgi:dTDP-4-dehydrorhamnose 3,5-epimerase-like enzyme
LDGSSGGALFVPSGFAHGFQSLVDTTIVNYAVTGVFSPENDAGIRWDSFGYAWPMEPTNISARDQELPEFEHFVRPFVKK